MCHIFYGQLVWSVQHPARPWSIFRDGLPVLCDWSACRFFSRDPFASTTPCIPADRSTDTVGQTCPGFCGQPPIFKASLLRTFGSQYGRSFQTAAMSLCNAAPVNVSGSLNGFGKAWISRSTLSAFARCMAIHNGRSLVRGCSCSSKTVSVRPRWTSQRPCTPTSHKILRQIVGLGTVF